MAKRWKSAAASVSPCRTCTLCCSLPLIEALDKPMYRPCRHIADSRCGIFGRPERPAACSAYACAWLSAWQARSPDRYRIPHPVEAGAYFHRDPAEKAIVLFVDPARPQQWKGTALVDILRPLVAAGETLVVFDRGRQMTVTSSVLFEEIVRRDYVALADAEGRPLDIASFADPGN